MLAAIRRASAGCAQGAVSTPRTKANHASLILGEWPRGRSENVRLARRARPGAPEIDPVAWLFLAVALASVAAAAAMIAYKANDTLGANTTVSHVVVQVNLFEGVPKYPDRCEC